MNSFLSSCGRSFLVSLAIILPLFIPTGEQAFAQEIRKISFNEAIQIALERNTTLRRATNEAELASISVDQERMQFYPNLRFSLGGSQSYGRNFSMDEGRILNTSSQAISAGVSSSVTVFDGFGNLSSLRQARLSLEAAEQDLSWTRQTVVVTVIDNYLAMIEAQEQLLVQRENLTALERQEAQIKAYVDAGARPISDLYQQQANVASARASIVNLERTFELSKVNLMQTLQLDPVGIYEFEAPALSQAFQEGKTFELEALLQQALSVRPDLEAAETRVRAAEQSVRASQATSLPTISLSGGYNTGYASTSPFTFLNQLDQRRGGSLSLSMSVPLFDRFATRQNTQRALIQVENARINLEQQQQDVALQVRRAFLTYRAAVEQLHATEAQLDAAERALQATQQRYDVGAATLLELTQARTVRVDSASQLVRARYNALFQEQLISYFIGELASTQAALN